MMNRLIGICCVLVWFGCSNSKEAHEIEPTPVSSPSGTGSLSPYLHAVGDSVVYLSWVEKLTDVAKMQYSTWRGDQWSAPQMIASGAHWFVNWADYPMMCSNGKVIAAHFLERSANNKYSYDVKFTLWNGDQWSDPALLNEDHQFAEHGFVSWLPYRENFFVTWLDGRHAPMGETENQDHHHQGSMSLRAAVINSNGQKVQEWEIDERTCDCCQTTAAMTSSGPVVVYRDRSEDEIRDIAIVRLENNSWTKPKSVFQDDWKINGCPVNGPRMSSKYDQLAIAWFSAATDPPAVKVIFSGDGGQTFDEPIRIDEGNPIGRVDLVLLEDQSAVVSWMEGMLIRTIRVTRDGKKSSAITIAHSSDARSAGFPQMALLGSDIIYAWTDAEEKSVKTAVLHSTALEISD